MKHFNVKKTEKDLASTAHKAAAKVAKKFANDKKVKSPEEVINSLRDEMGAAIGAQLLANIESATGVLFNIEYDKETHKFKVVEGELESTREYYNVKDYAQILEVRKATVKKLDDEWREARNNSSSSEERSKKHRVYGKQRNDVINGKYDPVLSEVLATPDDLSDYLNQFAQDRDKEFSIRQIARKDWRNIHEGKTLDQMLAGLKSEYSKEKDDDKKASIDANIKELEKVKADTAKYRKHFDKVEDLINEKVDALNDALEADAKMYAEQILNPEKRAEAHKKNIPLIALTSIGVIAAIGLLAVSICFIASTSTLIELASIFGMIGGAIAIAASIVGVMFATSYTDDKPVTLAGVDANVKIAKAMHDSIGEMVNSITPLVRSADPESKETVTGLLSLGNDALLVADERFREAKEAMNDARKNPVLASERVTEDDRRYKSDDVVDAKYELKTAEKIIDSVSKNVHDMRVAIQRAEDVSLQRQ